MSNKFTEHPKITILLSDDKISSNDTIEVDNAHDEINPIAPGNQEDSIFDKTTINGTTLCNLLKEGKYFKKHTLFRVPGNPNSNQNNIPTFGNTCYIMIHMQVLH